MRLSVPSHVAWPLFVVLLLLGSVLSTVGMVFATRSDGGVEPVPDYYAESLRWNEHASAQAASDRLGFAARVRVEASDVAGLKRVRFTVADSTGAPVSGLEGTVLVRRPHLVEPVARLPLGREEAPGAYVMLVPVDAAGLWDFDVEASREGAPVLFTLRTEV